MKCRIYKNEPNAAQQKFADKLKEMQIRQQERYELPESDTPWLCEKQLTESGIDIKAILEE